MEALCGPNQCQVSLKEFSSEDFDLGEYSSAFIITDSNVKKALGDRFPDLPVIEIEPGEGSKDLSKLAPVYEKLLELGADRKSLLIGVGGGVVTDITGFVGATFKRGVDFGFIPTSLLAQVQFNARSQNL